MKRVILTGVAFFCICSPGLAQKPPPADPSVELQLALAELGALEVLLSLQLTPEQLASLGPMLDTLQRDQRALSDRLLPELRSLLSDLATAKATPTPNVERAAKLRKDLGDIALVDAKVSACDAFLGALTDEQWRQLTRQLRVLRESELASFERMDKTANTDASPPPERSRDVTQVARERLHQLREATPERAERYIKRILTGRRRRLEVRGYTEQAVETDTSSMRLFFEKVRALDNEDYMAQEDELVAELADRIRLGEEETRDPRTPSPATGPTPAATPDSRPLALRRVAAVWLAEPGTRAACRRLAPAKKSAPK